MNTVVIEHVSVTELPLAWREKLSTSLGEALVTVRIEVEVSPVEPERHAEVFSTDDPAFGIWRDRDDMADVADYVLKLRQPRYGRDGSRSES